VTFAQFITKVARVNSCTKKQAARILDSASILVFVTVRDEGRFSWPALGVFSMRTRKARRIRNPQTNELMQLQKSRTIGFRPAKCLKARL